MNYVEQTARIRFRFSHDHKYKFLRVELWQDSFMNHAGLVYQWNCTYEKCNYYRAKTLYTMDAGKKVREWDDEFGYYTLGE